MFNMHELDDARVRWQLGHHLFFSYVQSLIIICSRIDEHAAAGDIEKTKAAIEEATYVLWGVAVIFKMTGGFSQAAYEGYVRPNMFEAAEGFSGMWAQDHDYLIKKVLRRLKSLFNEPPAELLPVIQKFRHAFAIMYDSHKYVCDKFEGGQPSLLMGENAQKTAAEMIDTFKRNRMLVLGVPLGES